MQTLGAHLNLTQPKTNTHIDESFEIIGNESVKSPIEERVKNNVESGCVLGKRSDTDLYLYLT